MGYRAKNECVNYFHGLCFYDKSKVRRPVVEMNRDIESRQNKICRFRGRGPIQPVEVLFFAKNPQEGMEITVLPKSIPA
jgi:hypothetical protein